MLLDSVVLCCRQFNPEEMAHYVGSRQSDYDSLERAKALTPWTPDPSLGHLLYAMRKVGPKIPTDDPDMVTLPASGQ
jgi:hypothetical protein